VIVAFDVSDRVSRLSWRLENGRRGSEEDSDHKASAYLVPRLARLCSEHDEPMETLGVVTGPGSFTGIRVGLAAAMGYGVATGTPLLGFTKQALVATWAGAGSHILLLPAGRTHWMACAMRDGLPEGEPVIHGHDALPDGDLISLTEIPGVATRTIDRPLTELVLDSILEGAVPSDHPLTPCYIRPADARKGTPLLTRLLARE